jgi:hypothetical protein
MQIVTKKVSKVPSIKEAVEAEKVKDTKAEKIAEAVKDVAPIVAQVAVDLAGPKKKADVKTWTAVGLSTLYIIIDLLQHLSVL